MEKAEALLRDIGMKEYEAKAFTAMVKFGVCSADQVSRISRIPLTRVYETMQSLQKLGIVTVLNTRPKRYKLVSVDALSNLLEHKKSLMKQELDRADAVIKEVKKIVPKSVTDNPNEIKEGFWILKGRETAFRKFSDEIKSARKEVLYFTDDFSWFPRFRKLIESKIKSGMNLKVLIHMNDKTYRTISDVISVGADVRGWDVTGLIGGIIDGKTIVLISEVPKPGVVLERYYGMQKSDQHFEYDCLTTENPILVNMVKTYFDIFWWRGDKPNKDVLAARARA